MDERRIQEAFERMTPSEEAKERMLENILAHSEAQGVGHPAQGVDRPARGIGRATRGAQVTVPRRARLRFARRIAIGAAACLALIVGVGMLTRPHAAMDAARTNDALTSSAPSGGSDNMSGESRVGGSDAAKTNGTAEIETQGDASEASDVTHFPPSIEFEGRSYQRSDEALSRDDVESVREPLAEINRPSAAPGTPSVLLVYSLVGSNKDEAVGVSDPDRERFYRYTVRVG